MSRSVIEKDGVFYMNSLVDGSVFFILINDYEYRVTWTDEKGYEAQPYKEYDKYGFLDVYSSLNITPGHVMQLSKLKHKL